MSIQLASDLHLEFAENSTFLKHHPLKPIGEVLILGGDILPIIKMEEQKHKDFFAFCGDHFEQTYWIPGNHEYYNGDIENYTGHFEQEILPNVHFVNNHTVHHDATDIILSTLWTRISERRADNIRWSMNDYRAVKNNKRRLEVDDTNRLFEENVQFIEKELSKEKKGRRLVVTHHVPTFNNYPAQYVGSSLNEAFAVDLNTLIATSDIDYWAFGHHHCNVPEFLIGETKMMTNQLGYTWLRENKGLIMGSSLGIRIEL